VYLLPCTLHTAICPRITPELFWHTVPIKPTTTHILHHQLHCTHVRTCTPLDLLPHSEAVKVFLPYSLPDSPPGLLLTTPPFSFPPRSYLFHCLRATAVFGEAVVESPPAWGVERTERERRGKICQVPLSLLCCQNCNHTAGRSQEVHILITSFSICLSEVNDNFWTNIKKECKKEDTQRLRKHALTTSHISFHFCRFESSKFYTYVDECVSISIHVLHWRK